MINYPLFLKLLRDLKQRTGMIIAIVLILATGVSNYTSMDGIYKDLDNAKQNYYNNYNLADFTIDLESAPVSIVKQLENLPNISRLRTRIRTPAIVNLPEKSYKGVKKPIPAEAISMPAQKQEVINNVKLYKGTWFSSPYAREVLLDEQFVSARNLKIGDRIKVLLPDQEHDLLIIGTTYSPEFTMILPPGGIISPEPQNYAPMYLPRDFLQQSANLKNSFNQLLGMTRDTSEIAIQNTMQLLSDKLNAYGVQLQTSQYDQISAKVLNDELGHLKSVITIFPAIFLLIVILVLNVMMTRLVTQQRSVLGILKALGYSNFSLMIHYIFYGIIIGLIGGILGIIMGLWLQEGMLTMYKTYFLIPDMALHIYSKTIFFGILISILSAILGTIFGTYNAVKLNPADAMRPPMPERGVHIFLENLKSFWAYLSFQNKMVMRAIFRNYFRSSVTLVASILATSIVFSSLSFLDSMDKMIDFSFDLIQHQDFTLSLRDPVGIEIKQTLSTLPYVKSIETQISVPVEMRHGAYLKRLEINGLTKNNKLYTPVDSKEKPIKVPSEGLVLTKSLAKMLNAKIEDKVILKPLIGDQKEIKVVIKDIVPSYIGFGAYADQLWLSQLLGNTIVTNNIFFKLYPNTNKQKFISSVNRFAPMINLVDTKESKDSLIETLNRFIAFSLIIMILFAGVIAVGAVINTAMISLSERERDVASLRVLGFTNLQVAKIFFTESSILNIIGIALGLILGIYFAYWMSIAFSTEIFSMPFVVTKLRLIQSASIMCLFVVISQLIIYRIIAKMNWFDVLNTRE